MSVVERKNSDSIFLGAPSLRVQSDGACLLLADWSATDNYAEDTRVTLAISNLNTSAVIALSGAEIDHLIEFLVDARIEFATKMMQPKCCENGRCNYCDEFIRRCVCDAHNVQDDKVEHNA